MFHLVRIGEDDGRAALMVDNVVQSISPEDGLARGGYWAAMVPRVRPRRALILGLGGATLASLIVARWGEGVQIVGVDDDMAVIETARSAGWLGVPGLEVEMADWFAYIRDCATASFDYVALDLFRGHHYVGGGLTKPGLRELRRVLRPGGRLAANMFMDPRLPLRIDRIAAMFEIEDNVPVGGNCVVHARKRR